MPWQALPARAPGKWRIVRSSDRREGQKEYPTEDTAQRETEKRNAADIEMERWAKNVKL